MDRLIIAIGFNGLTYTDPEELPREHPNIQFWGGRRTGDAIEGVYVCLKLTKGKGAQKKIGKTIARNVKLVKNGTGYQLCDSDNGKLLSRRPSSLARLKNVNELSPYFPRITNGLQQIRY